MKPSPSERIPLRARLASCATAHATVSDARLRLAVAGLGRSIGSINADSLRGRSILVTTQRQIATVAALIGLDGDARRLVLSPPDLPAEHYAHIAATAEVDTVLTDAEPTPSLAALGLPCLRVDPARAADASEPLGGSALATEWILFTSGTSGRPKMVVHDLASLAAPFAEATSLERGAVWSTFYDIRRYGGMTILLRALLSGASMVLSDPHEPVAEFFARASAAGVTHISGTPSHWRLALMNPAAAAFAPRYVRMSGEVADQALLDRLGAAFPQAGIAHAFASTEAGVAFSVADGLEGFPAKLVSQRGAVAIRVRDGAMLLRSASTARRYLGDGEPELQDEEGFVDTGDMVELRGDRYAFVGRRSGIVNVGGLKVHPEEVEAVINRHPRVQASRVRARRSPITGAVVVADVVLKPAASGAAGVGLEIVALCQEILSRHKVPVAVEIVAALDILPTGKMARRIA